MSAPRLEVRLDRIGHNAGALVARLAPLGIGVTGITKATLGCPQVARVLLAAGVTALGESRIEGIEALRRAGVDARLVLVRSPMLSQVARVVEHADASLNSELAVIQALSAAAMARGLTHGVILMIELGDLREGILPDDVQAILGHCLDLEGVEVQGIGANLACQSGTSPDQRNMDELGALATMLETRFGITLATVSGGNSANLDWALGGADVGRVNDLRLGEAILLGCEPLHRCPIEGLHTDAFTLVAEVIESKVKPTRPWGSTGETAFGPPATTGAPTGNGASGRALVALGRQDIDPDNVAPPPGTEILGASSDHLVLATGEVLLPVGAEVRLNVGYSALLAAMTSPFVDKVLLVGP